LANPKDENELIRPAVDGTLRALKAAQRAGVNRVVLTASMVTIMYSEKPENHVFGPDDWTDVTYPGTNAYAKSKTLAEQAARTFVAEHPKMKLTTIHPGLVTGTPMDTKYGSSLNVIKRMIAGRDPAQPRLPMPIVDIEDVSHLHIAAMENDATVGQRIIASARVFTFIEATKVVADAFPDRGIKVRPVPKWLLWILSFFNSTVKSILPLVGVPLKIDNSASLDLLPDGFVPANDSILRSARYLARSG
jgi:dihydroflavonol-4-reductase